MIFVFLCSLLLGDRYQMPLALVGLVSCLAMWELFRFCDNRWALDRFSAIRPVVIRIAQFGESPTENLFTCSYDDFWHQSSVTNSVTFEEFGIC